MRFCVPFCCIWKDFNWHSGTSCIIHCVSKNVADLCCHNFHTRVDFDNFW